MHIGKNKTVGLAAGRRRNAVEVEEQGPVRAVPEAAGLGDGGTVGGVRVGQGFVVWVDLDGGGVAGVL
jgi:hypothetical protein